MPVEQLRISEKEINEIPHVIKYMGSKRNILDYILNAIKATYTEGKICDLFAGTAVLAGALKNKVPIISNDIQEYSAIISRMYLSSYKWSTHESVLEDVIEEATEYFEEVNKEYSEFNISYEGLNNIEDFNKIEEKQRDLIDQDFSEYPYHLFTKYYSGTYWSFNQCLWIDALKKAIDKYEDSTYYYPLMSSLMFAMAYNSQSTGHYAQYRDAKNISSMNGILTYRNKKILPYFRRKFNELKKWLAENNLDHEVYSKDYRECLKEIPEKTLVYADPPYAPVHYSRFYHALETLVRYDYPNVKYKGRYRDDRHQSPFCKKTEVKEAFSELFKLIMEKKGQLVLSYSNAGIIDLDDLISLAESTFGSSYKITPKYLDYEHSTMGRKNDKSRTVKEALVLAKYL